MNNYVSIRKLKNLFMCSLAVKGIYQEQNIYNLMQGDADTLELYRDTLYAARYTRQEILQSSSMWLPCKET